MKVVPNFALNVDVFIFRNCIVIPMSSSISGCTVLVTGAGAGIGAATALHFAKHGDNSGEEDVQNARAIITEI